MASDSESEERRQLLQIFPNEVWDGILRNVGDAKDYLNISSASSHLNDLMRPRVTQILFPVVIEIVANREENKNDRFQWMDARQVCRAWRYGIDQVLQSQKYFQPKDNETVSEIRGMSFEGSPFLDFKTMEDFLNFEKIFDSTHFSGKENPFPARKVYLNLTQEEDDQDGEELKLYYFTACFQFLVKYGPHIWYCILRQRVDNPVGEVNFYSQWLRHILKLMPNLRGLEVDGRYFHDLPAELQSHLDNVEAFPSLSSLEYVSLLGMPLPIAKALVRSNPTVEHVDASQDVDVVPVCLKVLPPLKQLCVTVREQAEFEMLMRNWQPFSASRVECLWLDTSFLRGISWGEIFHMVETHFSRFVTELHLSLPLGVIWGAENRLLLPQVTKLYLELEFPEPLGFLLGMKNTLEELHLTVPRRFPEGWSPEETDSDDSDSSDESGQWLIKVYKDWRSPEKSNIWTFFPKLRFLETKTLIRGEDVESYFASRSHWNDAASPVHLSHG